MVLLSAVKGGFFLGKKPLDCEALVYSNSEFAINSCSDTRPPLHFALVSRLRSLIPPMRNSSASHTRWVHKRSPFSKVRRAGEYQDGAVEVLDAGHGVDGGPIVYNECQQRPSWHSLLWATEYSSGTALEFKCTEIIRNEKCASSEGWHDQWEQVSPG